MLIGAPGDYIDLLKVIMQGKFSLGGICKQEMHQCSFSIRGG